MTTFYPFRTWIDLFERDSIRVSPFGGWWAAEEYVPAISLDGLVSYWPMNEAAGTAFDYYGSNHLAETSGTIDAAAGKVGGARDFEAGDTESFEIADNADLSTGDIDFTISAWVQLESDVRGWVVGKWNTASVDEREYGLLYNAGTKRFQFFVSPNGVGANSVTASNFGTPSFGTWYFLVAWHDSGANTLNIQVNGGTVNSVSYSLGVFNSSAAFTLGRFQPGEFWDGLIDEVSFWKRVLTSDERTTLWNGGAGRPLWTSGSAVLLPFVTNKRGNRHALLGGRSL